MRSPSRPVSSSASTSTPGTAAGTVCETSRYSCFSLSCGLVAIIKNGRRAPISNSPKCGLERVANATSSGHPQKRVQAALELAVESGSRGCFGADRRDVRAVRRRTSTLAAEHDRVAADDDARRSDQRMRELADDADASRFEVDPHQVVR